MRKLLILALAAMLLLAGCEEETLQTALPAETSTAAETTTAQETTQPQEQGVYFIAEQTYYDAQGNQLAKMTVTLNDNGMPETVFMDSGSDVTHTIFYDEQSAITGSQQVRTLYGEDTVHISEYNDRGDRTKITLYAGTDEEQIQETAYVYDAEGRVIQKDQTKNGAFMISEKTEYDDHGNIAVFHSQQETISERSTYAHTYENGLLVKSECFRDTTGTQGFIDEVTTYTYDEDGRLIEKNIDDNQIYTFTYAQDGSVEKMVITKGNNKNVCEYNEQGNIALQYNYTDGNLTSKIVYVWEEFASQPTDAQLKILDLLGVVLPHFTTV